MAAIDLAIRDGEMVTLRCLTEIYTMTQDTKDRIQYGSAVAMIASGIVLAFLSFIMLHWVPSSVLGFVGEAVGFAGGVFGLGVFAHTKGAELDKRFQQLEQKINSHARNQ